MSFVLPDDKSQLRIIIPGGSGQHRAARTKERSRDDICLELS